MFEHDGKPNKKAFGIFPGAFLGITLLCYITYKYTITY